jgi:uncharacterized membrane protein/protein-disulfide isomerase
MSARIRWTVVTFALVGLGFSVASLWVHYRLLTDPTYVSPCNINASLNCAQVYLSPYGSLAGVPVAFGGVIWFGLVGVIAGFARTDRASSTAAHYVLGLSVVGLAVIAYLAYTSMFVLRTGCILCMGTYACVLAIAVVSKVATSGSLGKLVEHVGTDLASLPSRPAGFTAGIILLGAVAWGVASFPGEATTAAAPAAEPAAGTLSQKMRADFSAAWDQMPRTDLGVKADGAKVVVVKFNDYECPTCRQGEQMYKPIFERFAASHPGSVVLVSKDYPLAASCNVHMQRTIPGHEAACHAAAAARIAKDRDKFDEMTNWIWINQGTTVDNLRENAARILGMSVTDFDREYIQRLPAIRQDIADAAALQITGTPTYFINGVRIPGAIIQVEYFQLAIELELAKAAAPTP